MGKVSEEPLRGLTSDFFLWLLHWEFSDTILVLLQDQIIFAVSPKKARLLRDVVSNAPSSAKNLPPIYIVEHNLKQETPGQIMEKLESEYLQNSPFKTVATFLKD